MASEDILESDRFDDEYNEPFDDVNTDSVDSPLLDDEYVEPTEDTIPDGEDDQAFDEDLIQEADSGEQSTFEPDEQVELEDDEGNSHDSGYECGTTSDTSLDTSKASPVTIQPERSFGRGRFIKKALDQNNQELPPPPSPYNIEPEKGFYHKPAKIAKLPPFFYRKRETSAQRLERLARRVSSFLLNFQVNFNQISIIVDKDDSQDEGYQHACRRLQTTLPAIANDLAKPHDDIWSFGLYSNSLTLSSTVTCDLLDLIPTEINNKENRPYWLTFKRLPVFRDIKLRSGMQHKCDPVRGAYIRFHQPIFADLTSGALTSMSQFHFDKDYLIPKRTNWSILFREEHIEIQTNRFEKSPENQSVTRSEVKYRIPLDIIDRAAVIHLWKDGFNLFINMKGNIHQSNRERFVPKQDEQNSQFIPFKRQGAPGNLSKPLFSTIRLRIRLRSDDAVNEYLLKENSRLQKKREKDITREDLEQQIRDAFTYFLNFFNNNRIHICFGAVQSKNVSMDQVQALYGQMFPTFTQSYSWVMLCNIAFRAQTQISYCEAFVRRLHEFSQRRHENESEAACDDRFYRLCVYLHRRSSEYYFLDWKTEVDIGIRAYDEKYERSKGKKLEMPQFDGLSKSTAYVPSVVITPTSIRIRPLKLCKLNRVLREKKFGGVLNFALVELRDEAQRLLFPSVFRALKTRIFTYLTDGFPLTPTRTYQYLHHSQSQVKTKQFWFYFHDKEKNFLSHADAYTWMGNFDKERVVAKHAARIALCFTSTDKTIQIKAETVTYARDVKDPTGEYVFTDGVGTISTHLRDEIKDYLHHRYDFSVLQIRYGGCKGTLSVDWRLDDKEHQLQIRDSMNKFTTDHDILELCKLSAPRSLCLNRQDIVLLESRDIPDTNFFRLQNRNHLWLIRSLLSPSIAYELLQEKLLGVFQLRRIALNLNIVEEPFFVKLIITCAFNIVRELLDRTRIPVDKTKARNMFGIVDEYGILEYGQVFVQFSSMKEDRLHKSKDKEESVCEILRRKVVITKNPCHHPGDLRTFEAVDCPALRHLKDVVVFPQRGRRPHPNEISGSDLDGDEYVVIWHDDLIPETENEDAYAYDSQEDPPKMDRPITRDDINQVVMEVSEQDCLGSLTNIHLAYVDKVGIKSETCKQLAGYISQEVDAAKTGKHPLTEEEIQGYREGLGNMWPDFMKTRGKKKFYPSERVLGKLYRSARRAMTGWSRAISHYGNPHHQSLAQTLTGDADAKNEETITTKVQDSSTEKLILDPLIYHEDHATYLKDVKILYGNYRSELLEIISLYRFQDEIDLLCRCESMDASAGGSKKGGLEDSATVEVQNLVINITRHFYHEFDQRNNDLHCCKYEYDPDTSRERRIDCAFCKNGKLAKAACAYIYTYEQSNRLSRKSNRRILSFPWLFSHYLTELRRRNKPADYIDQRNTIVGQALAFYLDGFTPKFKVFLPENSIDIPNVSFYYTKTNEKRTSLLPTKRTSDQTIEFVPLLRACFVEVLNDWLVKQDIFSEICDEKSNKPQVPESLWHELLIQFLSYEYQANVRLLLASKDQNRIIERYRQAIHNFRRQWNNDHLRELQGMFREIRLLATQKANETKSMLWSYLDEYLILALQAIAIEKRLPEKWI